MPDILFIYFFFGNPKNENYKKTKMCEKSTKCRSKYAKAHKKKMAVSSTHRHTHTHTNSCVKPLQFELRIFP